MSLRTEKMEADYAEARKAGTLVPLNKEPRIIDSPNFYYWKIVANRFPHDLHHEQHVLVVLQRDCRPDELSLGELQELWHAVVPWADRYFDYVKFNLSSMRSVKTTPHLHLLNLKKEYK